MTPASFTRPRGRGVRAPGWLERGCRQAALTRLSGIEGGRVEIREAGHSQLLGRGERRPIRVDVHDPSLWPALALRGSVGAGESYMRGDWSSDDLAGLMHLLAANRQLLEQIESGSARLVAPLVKAWQALRRNTRDGSRRNIAEHYDLGNDFFELFLDPSMTYSCGIFEQPKTNLTQASEAKLDRLCRKLQLGPSDHLLEIGSGWGSLALHAATRYGCRVTTTTISRQQYERTRERIEEAGLGERIELLLKDYRDLQGSYDKLISIEMIEAVGHHYYETYFRRCCELLRPDGLMALQAITIADQAYDHARREVDFIKRYIFPGSCIPSLTRLQQAITRASDMRLVHLEDITPHYARTLREWRLRLLANTERVLALGYSREFMRRWEYYLALCEGGFAARYLGDVQLLLSRPANRMSAPLPALPGAA